MNTPYVKDAYVPPARTHSSVQGPRLARHVAHALPHAFQILFPQRHLAIPTTDRKDIPRERPRHAPHDVRELPCRGSCSCPRGRRHARRRRVKRGPDPRRGGRVLRPYQHSLVLRRGRNVGAREADIRCPRDVAHPVLVTLEHLLLDPRLGVIAEAPDLDEVVAAGGREAFHRMWSSGWLPGDGAGLGDEERAGLEGGRPGDGVAADGVAFEDVCSPCSVVYSRRIRSRVRSNMEENG